MRLWRSLILAVSKGIRHDHWPGVAVVISSQKKPRYVWTKCLMLASKNRKNVGLGDQPTKHLWSHHKQMAHMHGCILADLDAAGFRTTRGACPTDWKGMARSNESEVASCAIFSDKLSATKTGEHGVAKDGRTITLWQWGIHRDLARNPLDSFCGYKEMRQTAHWQSKKGRLV